MHEPSSDESTDEEEITKSFDAEAQLIVQTDSLPKKSADKYMLVYDTYKRWKEENTNALSESEENNLIVYFKSLSARLCPSTLWSVHAMLKSTLNSRDNIDISKFYKLKSLVKNNAKGHNPKKSAVLTWDEVMKFLTNAPDYTHLAHKVVLIFGICGATRCDELKELQVSDVEEISGKYLVSIKDSKNGLPRKFLIGPLFYEKVKKYISSRPQDFNTDRFFLQFLNGKCHRQVIGRNKIGQIPKLIAEYLNLNNPQRYTGHCLRRTSATLLSNSGANITMLKQLGGWKSASIAEGYIENSLLNRQKIFNKITHANANIQSHPQSSTSGINAVESKNVDKKKESMPTKIDCDDFSDDFVLDDNTLAAIDESFVSEKLDPPLPSFTTASNKELILNSSLETTKPSHFLKKPPISVFPCDKENQPPEKKIKLQQLLSANNNVDAVFTSTNSVTNRRTFTSSKNETCKPTSETKSKNSEVSQSEFTETIISKNPNVKYDNCVFHGNIINNFYFTKTPDQNI